MTWVLSDAELELEAWLRSRDVRFKRDTDVRTGFTTVTIDAPGREPLPVLGATPLLALTTAVNYVKARDKQAAEEPAEVVSLDNWLTANAQSHSTSLSSGTGLYTVTVVLGKGLGRECVGQTLLQALKRAVEYVRSRRAAVEDDQQMSTGQIEPAAPSPETFDVGDVVQLKSGGARMTVTSVGSEVTVAFATAVDVSHLSLPAGALRKSAVAEELKPGVTYRALISPELEERVRLGVETGMREARERAKGARDHDSFERVPAPDSLSSTAMARAVAALTDGGRELTLSRNGGVWHAKSSLGRASYLRDGRNLTEVLQDLVRDTGVSLG